MTDNNVTRTFRRIERLPVDKRRAALDYSLGPGSGKQIPLTLCLKCGKVQYRPLPVGCPHCGSTRPFYCGPRDVSIGVLEICLDCGQLQGKWPYPEENDALVKR
jgi:hypothetical protein